MNGNGRRQTATTGRWVALGAVLVCAGVYASQSYHPPGSGEAWKVTKVYLKPPGRKGAGVSGVVAIICNEAEGQHRVQVYAKGLRSGTVYSLWLRRFGNGELVSQKSATRRLFPPRTDGRGVFKHVTATLTCPAASYNDVVLARGSDTSDGVLFGKIPVEQHTEESAAKSGPPGSR